jgi:hypothetical protein
VFHLNMNPELIKERSIRFFRCDTPWSHILHPLAASVAARCQGLTILETNSEFNPLSYIRFIQLGRSVQHRYRLLHIQGFYCPSIRLGTFLKT